MTDRKVPVTVLGATGVVGQRFVERLTHHPLFTIQHLAASELSVGKTYSEAAQWRLASSEYGGFANSILSKSHPDNSFSPVVFSALDSGPAREIEPLFARAGALVFSNASTFRMDSDIPLLIPEVNHEHLRLLECQRKHRGWDGGIICNANCTATALVMALAPLNEAFGVETVIMTSMQAISGAGYPGVASLDIVGNVIPYIVSEEEKVEEETPKMLGRYHDGTVHPSSLSISALCHRVAVVDGHTEAVSVQLRGNPSPDDVRRAFESWQPEPQRIKLSSAPITPIRVHQEPQRPQPRLDVDTDGGMSIHIGRIRPCPVLGIKFTLLGHNTQRGAAGGSILNAELAHAKGYM